MLPQHVVVAAVGVVQGVFFLPQCRRVVLGRRRSGVLAVHGGADDFAARDDAAGAGIRGQPGAVEEGGVAGALGTRAAEGQAADEAAPEPMPPPRLAVSGAVVARRRGGGGEGGGGRG